MRPSHQLVLVAALLLSACATPTTAPTSPPPATNTAVPTETPTLVPGPTATLVPSATPEPSATPLPSYVPFTTANAKDVQDAYRWGEKGLPGKVDWSPDGKWLVVASTTGLWLYETDTLEAGPTQLVTFDTERQALTMVGQVGFISNTPNLYYFYTGNPQGQGFESYIQLVNYRTGELGATIPLTYSVNDILNVQLVALNSNGRTLALADPQGVRVVNLLYSSLDETIMRSHDEDLLSLTFTPGSLTFSPDGTRLAVSGNDRIEIYSWPDRTLIVSGKGSGSKLLFSPDNSKITIVGSYMDFLSVDAATGAVSKYHGTGYGFYDAAMQPNGSQFAISYGSVPSGIRFYDPFKTTKLDFFLPDVTNARSLAYSPDSSQLAAVTGNGGTLTIWKVGTGDTLFTDLYSTRADLQLDVAGTKLVAIGGNQARFYDPTDRDGTLLGIVTKPEWDFFGGLLYPNGQQLLGVGTVSVGPRWETVMQTLDIQGIPVSDEEHFQQTASGGFSQSAFSAQTISPDGTVMALGQRTGRITLQSLTTDAPPTYLYQDCCEVWVIRYSADGQTIATAGKDKAIYVWAADGELLQKLTFETTAPDRFYGLQDLELSRDGKYLAATDHVDAYVWDTASGQQVAHVTALVTSNSYAYISSVALNLDGTVLAVASNGTGELLLYEAQTGERLIRRAGTRYLDSLQFTPDGKLLLGIGEDGIIRFWGVQEN